MEIKLLKTNLLNQNKYNQNLQTPEFIGSLVTYPIGIINEKCLPCDGYKLKIIDYKQLHDVIGSKFNDGTEDADEFRVPDYNITGRFLQPSSEPTKILEAGLPNITGLVGAIGATGAVASGAFYWHSSGGVLSNSGQADFNAGFDASRCSAIYGKSTTVQPPSQGVQIHIRYK